jgi:hypothetical protein
MRKTCVIIQGQLYPAICEKLLETHKGISHKILSTWNSEDSTCVELCKTNGFSVLLQDPPEYKISANYQIKSLTLGFQKARELGFTHVFRMRTDMKINDLPKLLSLLDDHCPEDKLAFMTIYQNNSHEKPYITDHFGYHRLHAPWQNHIRSTQVRLERH